MERGRPGVAAPYICRESTDMRYEMTYGYAGDDASVRVASDAKNTVFTAMEDAASAAYWVYQSGVFDTGKYGRKYGKSPISKDFRGFLASSEVLISVGLIRLSVYAIPETENATRLFGLSCSDMGLSCISMFAHHASLKGYAIMLQILLMLNAL